MNRNTIISLGAILIGLVIITRPQDDVKAELMAGVSRDDGVVTCIQIVRELQKDRFIAYPAGSSYKLKGRHLIVAERDLYSLNYNKAEIRQVNLRSCQ